MHFANDVVAQVAAGFHMPFRQGAVIGHRYCHTAGIDAYVPHRATVELRAQPDVIAVLRVEVEAEPAVNELQLPKSALLDDPVRALVLGMVEIHKTLKDHDIVMLCRTFDPVHILQCRHDGLLTEDVFSRLRSSDSPVGVESVRQRVVDDVDAGICEHSLIGAEGLWNIPVIGVRSGPFDIAAGNRDEVAVR